ncbi:hypothetical protein SAMN04488700_1412 [Carnobacterium iners]|uniref:Uncharacterized protein n=1 Tax=Carnobacterium iners TaxID=1073423 RepID=A0A1X7N503_9LACT|nr:hypothetical protein [Carnobacterium iners]SEK43196.1 hypothetical protein SAMN04488114_1044 [Carnobacterium iners]SMH32501.1 hypothetical protein SAMN04488700_1412 [Carnobacterium iners]
MELAGLLSFLSSLIPLIIIITVVRSLGSALFNQQKGNKNGAISKYQEFIKEVNQEKDRLGNTPDKKPAAKQQAARINQKAADLAKQRNNPYLSTKKNQYQQPKVKSRPLAERNMIQPVSKSKPTARTYSKPPGATKNFVQTKRVDKRKKQTPFQKKIVQGIIYKEILDKPRALRPYK